MSDLARDALSDLARDIFEVIGHEQSAVVMATLCSFCLSHFGGRLLLYALSVSTLPTDSEVHKKCGLSSRTPT